MNYETHYTTLYESRAHIFQINPETKNSWLPKGDSAIPIAFVASIVDTEHNNSRETTTQCRRELKILGTNEDGENVLDATIMPKTTFTKRSQKFGQWIDHTGTVYGLGFNSEAELTEFVDTFQQLQREILSQPTNQLPSSLNNGVGSPSNELIQQQQQLQAQRAQMARNDKPTWYQQQNLTTTNGNNNDTNNNISETDGGRYGPSSSRASTASSGAQQPFSSNTLAHPGHQMKRQPIQSQTLQRTTTNGADSSLNNNSINEANNGSNLSNISAYPRSQSMFGLQSGRTSHNNNNGAGKSTPDEEHSPVAQSAADWQIRDQLKYENERLKQALEESSKNAIVWHNELINLRTNNVKLTQALQESKAHVEQWERELYSLRDENKELLLRVKALESVSDPEKASDYKKEVQKYKSYMEEIQDELRKKEGEVEQLQRSMEELQLKQSYNSNGGQTPHDELPFSTQKLDLINAKLEAKVNELVNVQREFSQLIEKVHHWVAPILSIKSIVKKTYIPTY